MSEHLEDEPDELEYLRSQGWRDQMLERLVVATERQASASEQISMTLQSLSSQLTGYGDGIRVHVTKVGP